MTAHACNPSTWEMEAGGPQVWGYPGLWVQGKPRPHSKTNSIHRAAVSSGSYGATFSAHRSHSLPGRLSLSVYERTYPEWRWRLGVSLPGLHSLGFGWGGCLTNCSGSREFFLQRLSHPRGRGRQLEALSEFHFLPLELCLHLPQEKPTVWISGLTLR